METPVIWIFSVAAALAIGWFSRQWLHLCSLTVRKTGHRVLLTESGAVLDEPKWSNEEYVTRAQAGDSIQFKDPKGSFLDISIED